jgi:hypothetical protein
MQGGWSTTEEGSVSGIGAWQDREWQSSRSWYERECDVCMDIARGMRGIGMHWALNLALSTRAHGNGEVRRARSMSGIARRHREQPIHGVHAQNEGAVPLRFADGI